MSAYYSRRDYERELGRHRGDSTSGTSCSLLTLLFIGLKLTGHFSHSWWLVLAPIWVPAALYLGLAVIAAGFQAAADHFERKARAADSRARLARGLDVKQ